MPKIKDDFAISWASINQRGEYHFDPRGGYAMRGCVEALQQQAVALFRTVDLMRRADDIETVRAIAVVAIGEVLAAPKESR